MSNDDLPEESPQQALVITERPKDVIERLKRVLAKPDLLERICEEVANGGSVVALCRVWNVSYRRVMNWINKQPDGQAAYAEALRQRHEWAGEMLISDIHSYAQADVRNLFDESGTMKPTHELDDETAKAVQSIQIKEVTFDDGRHQITHDIKLVDKLKARDMLFRRRGEYLDKTEHSGSVSIEDFVSGSWKKKDGAD